MAFRSFCFVLFLFSFLFFAFLFFFFHLFIFFIYLYFSFIYIFLMSKLEKLSDRFLRVGRHPFKIFQRQKKKQQHNGYDDPDLDDTQVCLCCHSDSQMYSRCWPLVFTFSAITDYPMPLPKGKKPGQHRDWGWIPILFVSAVSVYVYYAYLDRVIRKL
jgi:hypothetical protein